MRSVKYPREGVTCLVMMWVQNASYSSRWYICTPELKTCQSMCLCRVYQELEGAKTKKKGLTHLGSIVTSGARSTTGSSWASNTRSTTLTRESSVALKEKRDTSVTTSFSGRSEDEENVLFLRYSLLVQMGQRVHPHQEHPEQKKREGREGRHEDLMNKHSWHCIVCHAKLWNKDFENKQFSAILTCSPGLPVSPVAPWGPGSPCTR